jgi:hypothetical protein
VEGALRKLLLVVVLCAAGCSSATAPSGAGTVAPAGGSGLASATTTPAPARLPGEPDPTLTPGALNPDVTQANIGSTVCMQGWTATIRPSAEYTHDLKIRQIAEYGYSDTRLSSYEEDHLVPLSIGGAPSDPRNLWPEPITISLDDGRPVGADVKDALEDTLVGRVCSGAMSLADAQVASLHWVHYVYGIPMPGATPGTPAPTLRPTPHYWFCWDTGAAQPHHLGHASTGDHPCTDAELEAAGLLD